MASVSSAPALGDLEVPIDVWSEPFWQGVADRRILFPRCADCRAFRWPPGPFCPECRSQATEWGDAGAGRIFSYTVVTGRNGDGAEPMHIPALIEFPDAGHLRLLAPIVGADPDDVHVGQAVVADCVPAQNASVPVFRTI